MPYKNISCPHFPRCGGCTALDQPYELQLARKQEVLTSCFPGIAVSPFEPSPEPLYYRHKVQLPFEGRKKKSGTQIALGCYARDSHQVVDQRRCLVQDRDLSTIAYAVRDWAQDAGLSVYDERRKQGFLRHLLLRKGAKTGEVLLGLVCNGEKPIGSRNLADSLLSRIARDFLGKKMPVVGIVQNVNIRDTNVVLGDREVTWWGRPFLFERLGEWRFKLGLSTFFQVNPYQTPRLYDEVLAWVDHGPALLDCFCGVGSIALWVSKKCRVVTGIEENGAAIAAAKAAARVNGARNVRFLCGDVAELLPRMTTEGHEVAIFDPPRKGLDPVTLAAVQHSGLRRIIYVSCNPETLARDVKALLPRWRLMSVRGFDMFPHTPHIESVAVLDRE